MPQLVMSELSLGVSTAMMRVLVDTRAASLLPVVADAFVAPYAWLGVPKPAQDWWLWDAFFKWTAKASRSKTNREKQQGSLSAR